MTVDFNDYYGVSVFHSQEMGPRQRSARAQLFRRDTFVVIEEFFTDGGAINSADTRTIDEAKKRVGFRGYPPDWKDSSRQP